jgi:hypothetical protein
LPRRQLQVVASLPAAPEHPRVQVQNMLRGGGWMSPDLPGPGRDAHRTCEILAFRSFSC